MSRGAKRAKTLIELMGFVDEDIDMPEHDEGVLYFSDKKVVEELVRMYIANMLGGTIINEYYCVGRGMYIVLAERGLMRVSDVELYDVTVTEKEMRNLAGRVIRKRAEVVKKPRYEVLAGCEDREECCVTVYEYFDPEMHQIDVRIDEVSLEKPLIHKDRYLGFLDIYFRGGIDIYTPCLDNLDKLCQVDKTIHGLPKDKEVEGFIEVKVKVKSISELLRQLKYYKEALKLINPNSYVIPAVGFIKPVNTRFREVLEREGFVVLIYKNNLKA